MELSSKQRKILEKAAINMEPVVIVGGNGVTPSLEKMVENCLKDHELIKIKFNEFKDEKKELTLQIIEDTNATLVRILGNVAILYKESDDPEKRRFKL